MYENTNVEADKENTSEPSLSKRLGSHLAQQGAALILGRGLRSIITDVLRSNTHAPETLGGQIGQRLAIGILSYAAADVASRYVIRKTISSYFFVEAVIDQLLLESNETEEV